MIKIENRHYLDRAGIKIMTRRNAIEVIEELKLQRYDLAKVIFWGGCVPKNLGNKTSGLDLVILYDKLPRSSREGFIYDEWPINAYMYDKETLLCFFKHASQTSGNPTLLKIVAEGVEIPESSEFSKELKQNAIHALRAGPMLCENELEFKKYLIIDLLNSLKAAKSPHEKLAIVTRLYELMAEFYLLSHDQWSGQGRDLALCLSAANKSLADHFYKSFQLFFTSGNPQKIYNLATKIMLPSGTVTEYEFQLDVL